MIFRPMQWVMFFSGIIPLLVILAISLTGRKRNATLWLVALALFISVLADGVSYTMIQRSLNPWIVSYIYPIFQFGLLAFALIPGRAFRRLFIFGIVVASILSIFQGPLESPEVVVRVTGALLLTIIVWRRKDLGYLRFGIVIYLGIGSLFRMMFPLFMAKPDLFLISWYGYQASRFTGILYVVTAIFKKPQLKAV